MTKKASFDINTSLERIASPSVFDRIICEIEPQVIPAKYVECVRVTFYDGSLIEIPGCDIKKPLKVSQVMSLTDFDSNIKKIKEIKVFIMTELVEFDITKKLEKLFEKYNIE